jgi:hypothetical protein
MLHHSTKAASALTSSEMMSVQVAFDKDEAREDKQLKMIKDMNKTISKDCCIKIGTKFAGFYLWFCMANLSAVWI